MIGKQQGMCHGSSGLHTIFMSGVGDRQVLPGIPVVSFGIMAQ
jgi:hypothetical protein